MIVNLSALIFFMSTVTAQEVSNSVYKCPKNCSCELEVEITCNKVNLTEILIRDISPSVIKLAISKGNIPFIRQHTLGRLKNLKELILNDSNLSRIDRFAFKGMTKLTKLTIQNTLLTKLEKFSFSGLQNMTYILLINNRIQTIESSAFAGSSNIRLILLHNNPLRVIQSKAFANLRNVEYLILPSGIRSIQPDAFNSLDSVGLIRLPFMDLKRLESFTFRGLSHVLVLEIRESDLGIVRPRVFDGLVNVTSLTLAKNKIDHLQELRISANNNIKYLRLEGNHLLQIPVPGSVDVQVSENFTVVGNHFPCDCRVHSLLASPLANGTSNNFTTRNFCISPIELNGKPISSVNLESVDQCLNEYKLDSWNVGVSARHKFIPLYGYYSLFLLLFLRFC